MKSLLLLSTSVLAFILLSACTQTGSQTPSLQGNSAPTQANWLPDNNMRNARTESSTMIAPTTH